MVNFEWKQNTWHWCKITNPNKDNAGNIVRVYRGGNNYYTKDCDDWYEEEYNEFDFVVTDVDDPKTKVNLMDDSYWDEFTNNTAREVLVKLVENYTADKYEDFATEAVKLAQALTNKLKSKK